MTGEGTMDSEATRRVVAVPVLRLASVVTNVVFPAPKPPATTILTGIFAVGGVWNGPWM